MRCRCRCSLCHAGLTQLSYSVRVASGNTVTAVPEAPEGSAAALAAVLVDPQPDPPASTTTDKLKLDARLMQVWVCMLEHMSVQHFESIMHGLVSHV